MRWLLAWLDRRIDARVAANVAAEKAAWRERWDRDVAALREADHADALERGGIVPFPVRTKPSPDPSGRDEQAAS